MRLSASRALQIAQPRTDAVGLILLAADSRKVVPMNPSELRRRLAALVVAVTTVGTIAISAAPAQASLLGNGPCAATAVTQPFAPWSDANDYSLVPGGAFSGNTTTWTLSNGAALTPGGEPWNVSATDSASSVALTAGASAQSPFTCVDASDPTFRFFGTTGGITGNVLVSVVYQAPLLGQLVVPVGTLSLANNWQPSAIMQTGAALPAALNGGHGRMAIRFTGLTGSSQIDDVFIDPRMRG
jgi:hypothetical protein